VQSQKSFEGLIGCVAVGANEGKSGVLIITLENRSRPLGWLTGEKLNRGNRGRKVNYPK